ncbi:hypothetical protein J7643_12075 [bacterium]|nr:hypothetical protein [bacterium]
MQGPIRSQFASNPMPLKASGSSASPPVPETPKQGDARGPAMQGDALSLSADAKTQSACAHDRGGCMCSALQAAQAAQGEDAPIKTTITVTVMEPMKPIPPDLHQQTVKEALSSKKPVSFTNSLGQSETVQITPEGTRGKQATFDVRVGKDRFELQMPQGEDPTVNLALAVNYFSMNLPEIRDELDVLKISPDKNPTDAEFAKTYNMPNFSSAATAGGGTITFWHNGKYLDQKTFDHEMAHLMSPKASSKRLMMPDGYEAAIAKDSKTPTVYSKAAPIEDFADSWALYLKARQTSPEALAKFQADFPNRAAAMEQFWNRFAPSTDKGQANPATRNQTPSVDLKTLEVKQEYRKIREEVLPGLQELPSPDKLIPAKPPTQKAPEKKAPEPKPPEKKTSEQKSKPPIAQEPLDADMLFVNEPMPEHFMDDLRRNPELPSDDLRRKMEVVAPDTHIASASQPDAAEEARAELETRIT